MTVSDVYIYCLIAPRHSPDMFGAAIEPVSFLETSVFELNLCKKGE